MNDKKTTTSTSGPGAFEAGAGAGPAAKPLSPGELAVRFAALEKGLRELRGHL